jgi:hypothetical protein
MGGGEALLVQLHFLADCLSKVHLKDVCQPDQVLEYMCQF